MTDKLPPPALAVIFSDAIHGATGSQRPFAGLDNDMLEAVCIHANDTAGSERWELRAEGEGYAVIEDDQDTGLRVSRWRVEGLSAPMYRLSQGELGINLPSLTGLCARLYGVLERRGGLSAEPSRHLH